MELIADNYKKGDAFPPRVDSTLLRIYNFQGCPFAERSMLVLNAKQIEHEEINVNLLEKPEWLIERNSVGKVPVIEFDSDNKILTESLIVSEYLDEAFSSGRQLRETDPYLRAKDKVFLELISPHLMAVLSVLYKDDSSLLWTQSKESLKKVEELLKKRKTDTFLSGNEAPGLTDYMIWPFIERIPIIIDILNENKSEDYIREELPTIHEYRQQMLSDSTVKNVCLDYDVLLKFVKEYRKVILVYLKK